MVAGIASDEPSPIRLATLTQTWRANLIAASFASEPEDKKKLRDRPKRGSKVANLVASVSAGSEVNAAQLV